jgi:hypothetical protein
MIKNSDKMRGINHMIRIYMKKFLLLVTICCAFGMVNIYKSYAQVEGNIAQQVKWIQVNSLHHWFSNGGAEIEYGRRGRGQYLAIDQMDGLGWPGEYGNKVYTNVGNSLWIGTTNFADPVSGKLYRHKVVGAGRRFMYLGTEIFPEKLTLIAKFARPEVIVDDINASNLDYNDDVSEIDPNIPADRMMLNVVNTPIGITVTRKILAFTQQYNDNYFIYEYVFKNTGIIDNRGTQMNPPRTLTGAVFHWQHRYALAGEAYRDNWSLNGTTWGLNTINDCVGQDTNRLNWDGTPYEFRAIWAWFGPHSTAGSFTAGVGFPKPDGMIMSGTQYAGVVVLHADKSPTDTSDDPFQPRTTQYNGADQGGFAQMNNQYDAANMTNKYNLMTKGHPAMTHAQFVGRRFADAISTDAGGMQSAQGFGPYDLNPGDSIRIVLAEAIAGISRDENKWVVSHWFNKKPTNSLGTYDLPDKYEREHRADTTTDQVNTFKERWVFVGKELLFKSFRRAIANYRSGYQIPQPPAPPTRFEVKSGGDKIMLTWAPSPDEGKPAFDGYSIYRAEGRTDTTFQMIYSCDASVHSYEDKTPRRGFGYFYYIVSKDDGSTNLGSPRTELYIPAGEPLESSKFYTMTNKEAFLMRPAGQSLSEIRVVPNPYNIKARQLQFGQNAPDRLAFYGLPPFCVIKIYTETGDLIETINHNNSSGDELWYSLTSSRQVVASGLYIAYFEVTQDTPQFRKGENTFRKFIIIR